LSQYSGGLTERLTEQQCQFRRCGYASGTRERGLRDAELGKKLSGMDWSQSAPLHGVHSSVVVRDFDIERVAVLACRPVPPTPCRGW
jgi:hypothetical protein